MRSFSPSSSFWWTSTVSPTRKSGTSDFATGLVFSTSSMMSVLHDSILAFAAALVRFSSRHAATAWWLPLREHLRHRPARGTPAAGCTAGYSSPPGLVVAVVGGTRSSPSTPGIEPDHRVDHHHRRHFAAVAHVVADAESPAGSAPAGCGRRTPRTGRTAAAAAAASPAPRPPAASAARPAGVSITTWPRRLVLRLHRFDAIDHRLGHQHHSGAAAERPVVHLLVLVLRPSRGCSRCEPAPARPRSPA